VDPRKGEPKRPPACTIRLSRADPAGATGVPADGILIFWVRRRVRRSPNKGPAPTKERLGVRFRELDVPLLVEWPEGRREAVLLVLEEETDTAKCSIHRLAHDCLDLAELFGTDRVVPVANWSPARVPCRPTPVHA
jgi:hypothetical protein